MTESERARKWRKNTMNLTQEELARALGFSARQTVIRMESGSRDDGKPYSASDWRLYKNACAGLHYQKNGKRKFNW